jgi:intracellular multiplication protein IcmO
MPIDPRFKLVPGQGPGLRRDVRPWSTRLVAWLKKPDTFQMLMGMVAMFLFTPVLPIGKQVDMTGAWAWVDAILILMLLYFRWFKGQLILLPFKLPSYAKGLKDKNNPVPGKATTPGKPEGILFLGNIRDGSQMNEELWLTNSDARTHILFLGTTGAGKTEGLKSLVTNSLCWGSGFVYVDGKAQNTLWGDIYSLARRFGRDDDVLVLNYMTGNSDSGSRSNSLNPFSIGSASYLTQMMVGLMDDSGDDNAMWKGRAISLLSSLMPALTWKRDNQGLMMDVGVIRDHLTMQQMIKMSRDPGLPDRVIRGLQSYLDTLPGYVDSAFDDEGNERPQSPDQPHG